MQVIASLMRFEYSFADLLAIEKLHMRSQRHFFAVPEYRNCWKPVFHWSTHCAHDIFRWGPPRLLWCMLFEMKNGHLKRGCKRSNLFNPAKSTAEFYVGQSDYELRMREAACDRKIQLMDETASGKLVNFGDVPEAQILAAELQLADTALFTFYSQLVYEGVSFRLDEYVLVGPPSDCFLARLRSMIKVDGEVYLWLRAFPADTVQVNEWGALSASLSANLLDSCEYQLVHLKSAYITALWDTPDYSSPTTRHFIVKW